MAWMTRFFLPLLLAALIISACGQEATDAPVSTPDSTPAPASTPAPTAVPAPTPVATPDWDSVVRRVLAEVRSEETPTPTPEPTPTLALDVDELTFAITERVLATIEARETPTPEPTPEPTPTPTPEPTPPPTPALPSVIRGMQDSMLRIVGGAANTDVIATGVVVGTDADTGDFYLLTRYERVANVDGLAAVGAGGTSFEAVIHGADETRDLALLRACCDANAAAAPFGDALTLQVGSEVAALEFAEQAATGLIVSRGIVSSVLFDVDRGRWVIQSDAAVSGRGGGCVDNHRWQAGGHPGGQRRRIWPRRLTGNAVGSSARPSLGVNLRPGLSSPNSKFPRIRRQHG